MDIWAIVALVVALIAIVALIILYVIYFTHNTPTNYVTYTVIQGTTSSPTFVGNNNTIYIVPTQFSGTITVTKPTSNVTNTTFVVSNVANGSTITVAAQSGISVVSGAVPGRTGATFIWLSPTSIQRIY